jgi:hypothetical protein
MYFKKRFSKKAETSLIIYVIIVLLIVILIAVTLWVYIDNIVNNKRFEREFLARDISLLTTTVFSSPNDIVLAYSYKGPQIEQKTLNKDNSEFLQVTREFNFIYDFRQNMLSVYEPGKENDETNKAIFYIIEDKAILFSEKKIEQNSMKFIKDNVQLQVEQND